jgi:alpha-beta hydrolase superfamily lysophospholipase
MPSEHASKPHLNACLSIVLSLACLGLASCSSMHGLRGAPALGPTTWTSYDRKEMPWNVWSVPRGQTEKGVVITVHGLSGAASDFWLLGERLPKAGYTVYGYELRGQGHDPDLAMRGDIYHAEKWLRDLLSFHRLIRQRHPKVPIIWYGESLGSLIAMHTAAKERRGTPDALILASPVAGLRQQPGGLERFLLLTTSHLLPNFRLKLGDIAGVDEKKMRVTSTSTLGDQMAVTPHHVPEFSLRTLREINSLLEQNSRAARHIEIPVLVLASPHDIVSSPDQVQQLFKEFPSEAKRLHWYTRSYHLLLHDVQHEDVLKDVTTWLKARTKK